MATKTKAPLTHKKTAYTFTLSFPKKIKTCKVTPMDYYVTSNPPAAPPLNKNTMPAVIKVGDTITFTYPKCNGGANIKSCMLTRYNIDKSTSEVDTDFLEDFDKPIPIDDKFIGTWIFHLLGLYKYKGKRAAYYLDPEATFRT